MYQPNDLYKRYQERILDDECSSKLPDVTKKSTLKHINWSINLCDHWNSALDIGAGNGHYLAGLASKFKKNIGIEIDPLPPQKILEEKYKNIKFVNTPIEKYPENETFDFVLLMDIFEHIPNISNFIQKVGHLQRQGGVLHIVTPNPITCGVAEESDIFHTKTNYHGHIKHYTKNEIIDLCTKAGYRLEFLVYEETELRQKLRIIVKGISRRHKIFVPLLLPIVKPMFWAIEALCYWNEKRFENDMSKNRSIVAVFKKL